MKIAFTQFLGANSDVSDELLQPNYAVEATNVLTDQGALSTWKGLNSVGISPVWNSKTGANKKLFLMNNNLWLAWPVVTDAALLQMANNSDWQVAFTDLLDASSTAGPKYTSLSLAVAGGGTTYPTSFHPLGIIAPTAKLVATVIAKPAPANSVIINWEVSGTVTDAISNRIARTYVYTYVNEAGRQGPPSASSDIAYSNDDETITLSGFIAAPQVDITKIRIYVASSGGTFNFLKESAASTANLSITDNTVGTAITSTTYSPPPNNLQGITAMANGMLAGYVNNNLYFSEPYQSHAWPEDYIKSVDYPIKGLSAIGNMLYISTDSYPLISVGNSPAFMSFTKLGAIQANVSSRSMVNMGVGVMYASRDGIVLLAAGQAVMVSDGIISELAFQAMVPSSIHAYFYRDKYIGFYDSGLTGTIVLDSGETLPAKGGFILDTKRKTVSYTDVYCDAAFSDKLGGKLYLSILSADTNKLYEWNEGTPNLTQAWKTKPVQTEPINFSVARVWAKRYPLTFQLYGDDAVTHTQTVTSQEPFRLPSGYRSRKWAVRITGDTYVNGIFLATSVQELMQ